MSASINRVVGIVGWKNSGKTTLIADLVAELTAIGMRVSTLKHAHHGFELDKPGKDSYAHAQAGAHEVLITSNRGWALLHQRDEHSGSDELAALLRHLAPVDIVLAEGFKEGAHAKIEIYRDPNKNLLALNDRTIKAIVSPGELKPYETPAPRIDRADISSIVGMVLSLSGHRPRAKGVSAFQDKLRKASKAGVWKRSIKTSLLVGTALAIINHGNLLISGSLSAELVWKIMLTYAVPFCVATYASISAMKTAASSDRP